MAFRIPIVHHLCVSAISLSGHEKVDVERGEINTIFVNLYILVAPPPKASIPRRSGNNTSASQDLFGSTPFDAPLQPSPFDVSVNL